MRTEDMIEMVKKLIDDKIALSLENDDKDEAYELHMLKSLVVPAIRGYYEIVPVLQAFKGLIARIP